MGTTSEEARPNVGASHPHPFLLPQGSGRYSIYIANYAYGDVGPDALIEMDPEASDLSRGILALRDVAAEAGVSKYTGRQSLPRLFVEGRGRGRGPAELCLIHQQPGRQRRFIIPEQGGRHLPFPPRMLPLQGQVTSLASVSLLGWGHSTTGINRKEKNTMSSCPRNPLPPSPAVTPVMSEQIALAKSDRSQELRFKAFFIAQQQMKLFTYT